MNFDDMNRMFVIAAYSVMWIVVLGYMMRLVRKGSRARQEYERIGRKQGGDR
jgi:CcmD family protein